MQDGKVADVNNPMICHISHTRFHAHLCNPSTTLEGHNSTDTTLYMRVGRVAHIYTNCNNGHSQVIVLFYLTVVLLLLWTGLRGEKGGMCTLSLPLGYGGMNPERSGGMNPLD